MTNYLFVTFHLCVIFLGTLKETPSRLALELICVLLTSDWDTEVSGELLQAILVGATRAKNWDLPHSCQVEAQAQDLMQI